MVFRYKCCSSCAPKVRYYLQQAWGNYLYEDSYGSSTIFEINMPDPGTSDQNSLVRMCFRAAKSSVAPHGIVRLSTSSSPGNYRCRNA
ncbi:hypothetical protein KVR01_013277 [Diaporthe batatas]|uniref:uncharacterized protein n=1 Tax=Diaporthe batatas TaxID=748121 RepID=UPI001D043ABC|nr:uncharacterized protein KVR01_013277 [Diaporthe batatas]KAG8156864.1 hypothetical protein KVR01_013277 [Diaporthe batatas]